MSDDQEKIKIAHEYFMRVDQGRPDILELFQEDAEVYFPKFGFGFGWNSFLEMAKGFKAPWNTSNTITTFLVSRGQAAKLLAGVSATSSSFEMVAYRACTPISIPTIWVRMRRDFDGVGTVGGESDDHPSGDDSWAR